MIKKGFFITFEGTDGVGKSTQLKLTAEWLSNAGYDVITTREPGGGAVSERIRALLLDPNIQMENVTELMLYQAARVEHIKKIIEPALEQKKVVLCDRFTDATEAYQGYARGLGQKATLLNKIATNGLTPQLTILLDLPPARGLARAKKVKSFTDRLENEGVEFQKKVRLGYLAVAKKEPRRVKVVAVQESIEQTQRRIREIISRSLRGNIGAAARPSLLNGRH